jgi:broad specificity phosphatase PhoE
MLRHRQTAEACLVALHDAAPAQAEWQADPGFNEYDHEEVLTRHRPDFIDPLAIKQFLAETDNAKQLFQQMFRDAMTRWMSGEHDADYREPWPMFRERCIAALDRVLESAGKSEDTIIFTSGGTIATVCQHLLGLPNRQMADLNWSLVNSAVTKLFYQPGRISLSYLNNYAHLEVSGEKKAMTYR